MKLVSDYIVSQHWVICHLSLYGYGDIIYQNQTLNKRPGFPHLSMDCKGSMTREGTCQTLYNRTLSLYVDYKADTYFTFTLTLYLSAYTAGHGCGMSCLGATHWVYLCGW